MKFLNIMGDMLYVILIITFSTIRNSLHSENLKYYYKYYSKIKVYKNSLKNFWKFIQKYNKGIKYCNLQVMQNLLISFIFFSDSTSFSKVFNIFFQKLILWAIYVCAVIYYFVVFSCIFRDHKYLKSFTFQCNPVSRN